jgi:integrase
MARRLRDRLTAAFIASATRPKAPKPGMHNDGVWLYLAVSDSGSASWLFRFKIEKKPRQMGLGSLDEVTLAQARELADDARRRVREGVDPLEERRAAKLSARIERARAMTFKQAAEAYIAAHRAGWTNAKHSNQWPQSLDAYAFPIIGDLPVATVDLPLVMKVIEPLWSTKPETASRVRGRIEVILDWATVRGYRQGENPARWRGHLESLLPKKTKVRAVEHLAALPYSEVAAFMAQLRGQEGIAARALEFTILTAALAGEVVGAGWDEFDMARRIWVVPASRMKARKEHRVPLSDAAMAILERMAELRQNNFVFPGRFGGVLAADTMLVLAKRLARQPVTSHGFRSTFRD